jgi:hypothetical protein
LNVAPQTRPFSSRSVAGRIISKYDGLIKLAAGIIQNASNMFRFPVPFPSSLRLRGALLAARDAQAIFQWRQTRRCRYSFRAVARASRFGYGCAGETQDRFMLREIRNIREIPGQGPRRWFSDAHLDLFVWYDEGGRILGFQLCFDKDTRVERALTFTEEGGYSLDLVAGEDSVCDLGSPVLVPAGEFSLRRLIDQLGERGAMLERSLYDYLREKLEECPALLSGQAPETASRP